MNRFRTRGVKWWIGVGLLGVLSLYCIMGLAWWLVVSPIKAHYVQQRLLQADRRELLMACREMMSNFPVSSSVQSITKYPKDDEFGSDIPAAILQLKPMYLTVQTNQVYVRLYGAPRVAFIGFAQGEMGYGTKQLTNGLWLCE